MEAVQSWRGLGSGGSVHLSKQITDNCWTKFNLQFIECTDCIVHNKVAKEVECLVLCVFGISGGGWSGGVGVIIRWVVLFAGAHSTLLGR